MNASSRRKVLARKRGWTCHYCRCNLTADTATVDHITPRSKGGTNALHNTVLACRQCNTDKADKTIGEVERDRGMTYHQLWMRMYGERS